MWTLLLTKPIFISKIILSLSLFLYNLVKSQFFSRGLNWNDRLFNAKVVHCRPSGRKNCISALELVSYQRLWSLSEYKIKVFFSKARIVKNQLKHGYISIAKDWIPPDNNFWSEFWALVIILRCYNLADTCQWMFLKIGSWLLLETRCHYSLKCTRLKKTFSYQMCLRFIWYYWETFHKKDWQSSSSGKNVGHTIICSHKTVLKLNYLQL